MSDYLTEFIGKVIQKPMIVLQEINWNYKVEMFEKSVSNVACFDKINIMKFY